MFRKYWWTPLVLLLLILVGLAFYWEFGRTPTFESNYWSRNDPPKILLDKGCVFCYPKKREVEMVNFPSFQTRERIITAWRNFGLTTPKFTCPVLVVRSVLWGL